MISPKGTSRMIWIFGIAGIVLLGCSLTSPPRWRSRSIPEAPWSGDGFTSNGERIYFTAINEQGETISYTGGPVFGGMMMQPRLACVSCHGIDGRGGRHMMHMQVMDAPDIRYEALSGEADEHAGGEEGMEHGEGEYDLEMFRQAVVAGQHPDGEDLSYDMPRWEMNDEDLAALFDYLKSLP